MKIRWQIDDCQGEDEMLSLYDRFEADCHDPFTGGVFDCPCCKKIHKTCTLKGSLIAENDQEKIVDGRDVVIAHEDGLVNVWVNLTPKERL